MRRGRQPWDPFGPPLGLMACSRATQQQRVTTARSPFKPHPCNSATSLTHPLRDHVGRHLPWPAMCFHDVIVVDDHQIRRFMPCILHQIATREVSISFSRYVANPMRLFNHLAMRHTDRTQQTSSCELLPGAGIAFAASSFEPNSDIDFALTNSSLSKSASSRLSTDPSRPSRPSGHHLHALNRSLFTLRWRDRP